MSDFIRIKIAYPSEDGVRGGSPDLKPRFPGSREYGGDDRTRRPTRLAYIVLGLLIGGGAIGGGYLFADGSDPSGQAQVVADATAAPTEQVLKERSSNEVTGAKEPVAAPAVSEPVRVVSRDVEGVGNRNILPEEQRTASPETAPSQAPASGVPAKALVAPPVQMTTIKPPTARPATAPKTAIAMAAVAPEAGSNSDDGPNDGTESNDYVARSQLTSAIRGREPVDQLASRIKMGKARGHKLFYFTELKGLTGTTVYHRWEYDGRIMANLRFTVRSDRWRGYSSKTIPASAAGEWRVVVADADGDVLASSDFVVE